MLRCSVFACIISIFIPFRNYLICSFSLIFLIFWVTRTLSYFLTGYSSSLTIKFISILSNNSCYWSVLCIVLIRILVSCFIKEYFCHALKYALFIPRISSPRSISNMSFSFNIFFFRFFIVMRMIFLILHLLYSDFFPTNSFFIFFSCRR